MSNIESLGALQLQIAPLRQSLLEHPVYGSIRSIDGLRTFMEHHVFAVWDFMTLLKSLQLHFTSAEVLWQPKPNSLAARFVNEIVLAEETDEDGEGGYCSHFELYLRGMRQCGANTAAVEAFIEKLQHGEQPGDALMSVDAPPAVSRFVGDTLKTATSGDACRIAAAFTFGREDLLPDVFQRIVSAVNAEVHGSLDAFLFYLERHIELDGDHHGPLAERMMQSLCGSSADAWAAAIESAKFALQSRLTLWDAIQHNVEAVDRRAG